MEVAKKKLKETKTVRKEILWSDKTKTELVSLTFKCHIRKKPGTAHHLPNTIPTVKHGGGTIILWCFQWEAQDKWSENGTKYRDILYVNLVLSAYKPQESKGSPFSRTMTNTQPRQHKCGFGTTVISTLSTVSLSDPATQELKPPSMERPEKNGCPPTIPESSRGKGVNTEVYVIFQFLIFLISLS